MPYALFTNNEQISKAYKTEHEVWKKADEAGLVVDVASEEEKSHPKRVLDEDYCIKPCPADIEEKDTSHSPENRAQDIRHQASQAMGRGARQAARRAVAAKS
jgi:hypothetical protein